MRAAGVAGLQRESTDSIIELLSFLASDGQLSEKAHAKDGWIAVHLLRACWEKAKVFTGGLTAVSCTRTGSGGDSNLEDICGLFIYIPLLDV